MQPMGFGFMDQHNVAESFPAGNVITVQSSQSLHAPGVEAISSTVCSDRDVAYVLYVYNNAQSGSHAPRALVMSTLEFNSHPTLVGEWNGQGAVLIFDSNGTVTLSYLTMGVGENRGTYIADADSVKIYWTTVTGVQQDTTWNCRYTIEGSKLTLDCSGQPKHVYTR
jgi:hypothetical protein